MKRILVIFALFASACAKTPSQADTTINNIEHLRTIAPVCTHNGIEFVCKSDAGGDGDSALWGGLLCLSGETIGCNTVKHSQAADGRVFRSPSRIYTDGNPTFSRDMFLGFLGYIHKTQDMDSLTRFKNWLPTNNGKLCLDPCELTVTTTTLMDLISGGSASTFKNRSAELGLLASSYTNKGYEAHLVGVQVFIRQQIQNSAILKQTAAVLAKRYPENPFFAYIHKDNVKAAALFKQYLPDPSIIVSRTQWTFERDEFTTIQQNSMIWEWIFLYNLLSKTGAL